MTIPEHIGRPNGVSSRAVDPRRRVAPLEYRGTPEQMRARVRGVLGTWPRTRVFEAGAGEWRVECRSRGFGFVDDLVLVFDDRARRLEVASIARTGYWDLGVNRRRVETLRRALAESVP